MIWLYASDNENYSKNGDIALVPNVCEIDTSEWELTLNHPIDEEGRWKSIIEGAVIKVPSFLNNDQLFRIFKKEKADDGVEVKANPIFFDSANDTMLIDVRPTDKNGQQALDILTQNTKYSGSSDIDNISTAYYQYKNLMEALMSDDENSFINRWGGEVLYDNFNVIINENIGEDRGVQLLYGKNIPVDGLSEETSIETVVTRIYPKAYNGWTLSNNGYVDSPLSNNYTPCVHGKVIEFADVKMREDAQENDESNGIIVCDTQEELDNILIQKCNEQFDAGIDKPAVTIKANMILLENTTEYEEYKSLETVSLGDTIYCYHRKLEIETKARVTSLVYDCIRKKTISVVIGTDPYNYFSETSSVINAADKVIDKGNNTLMADKIAGIINLLNTSLRAQKNIAQKQDVRAILFEDLDPDSPTFGALCIGTQGIQIAKERNETNTDWQWGTAIDFQSINADYILTGILTDRNGNFYLNMNTGELVMSDGTFKGALNTNKDIYIGNNIYFSDGLSKYIMLTDDVYINLFQKQLNFNCGNTILKLTDTTGEGDTEHGTVSVYLDTEDTIWLSSGVVNDGESSISLVGNKGQTGYTNRIDISAKNEIYLSRQPTVGSDKRLKENIKEIDLTGILNYLNIYEFNYKGSKRKTVGVIAQDFIGTPYEDIILSKNEKGYYSVDYNVINMAIAQFIKKVMKCSQ